ncbi:MAG: PUA domain-containing protein [Thermoplasmatota archaeon]
MSELRIRKRGRLKSKPARALRDELSAALGGTQLWAESAAVETGSLPDYDVIIVDGVVHGLRQEGKPFLSMRGLLAYRPEVAWVTVDMGAVRFVHNGADVMSPGITEAHPDLQPGDWCWIRDEKNGQPLGVGRCLMAGAEMGAATKGKAVASVHHIGDKLWELDAA